MRVLKVKYMSGGQGLGQPFPRRGRKEHIRKRFVSFSPKGNQNSHTKVIPQRSYNRKQCFYGIFPKCIWIPKFLYSSQLTAEDISKQGRNFGNASLWVHTHSDLKATVFQRYPESHHSKLTATPRGHSGGFTATPDKHCGSKHPFFP